MVCDVDVELPDATRTHTLEVARGLAYFGFGVELVARGSDPALSGVRFHSAALGQPPALRQGCQRQWPRSCCSLEVQALSGKMLHSPRLGRPPDTTGFSSARLPRRGRGNDAPHGQASETRAPGVRGFASDYVKRTATITMGRCAARSRRRDGGAQDAARPRPSRSRQGVSSFRTAWTLICSLRFHERKPSVAEASTRAAATSCSQGTSRRGSTSRRCCTRSS